MTTPVYCSCGCVQYVQRLPSTIGLPAVYTGQSRSGKLIREMEQEGWGNDCSRRTTTTAATFFTLSGKGSQMFPIDEAVRWAKTLRGGRHTELFYDPDRSGCLRWGLCDV